MPSRCTVCASPDVARVEAEAAGGRSNRAIARDFGLGHDAIARHLANHAGKGSADAISELSQALRDKALAASSPGLVREYRLAIAQEAARGAKAPPVPLEATPEWLELRGRLLEALRPFPEAARAVADALEASGGTDGPEVAA